MTRRTTPSNLEPLYVCAPAQGTLELVVSLPASSAGAPPPDCDTLASALQGYFILGDWERFQVCFLCFLYSLSDASGGVLY
jgi:hypothetical protein